MLNINCSCKTKSKYTKSGSLEKLNSSKRIKQIKSKVGTKGKFQIRITKEYSKIKHLGIILILE